MAKPHKTSPKADDSGPTPTDEAGSRVANKTRSLLEDEAGPLFEAWLARLRDGDPVGHSYGVLLGLAPMDVVELDRAARRGLPCSTWERFGAATRLPKSDLMEWVQVSARTLSRRRDEGRLQRDESDRLLRAARIFARAVALFHADIDAAARWLVTPHLGLGGATPLVFSATDAGAVEVERLAGRLEHGIPS